MDEDEMTIYLQDKLATAKVAGWRSPEAVRKVVSRRRRRRVIAAGCAVAVASAALTAPRWSVTKNPDLAARINVGARLDGGVQLMADVKPLGRTNASAVTNVAKSEQEFALALLKQLATSDGSNMSSSPASLAIALSMLENGAVGKTRAEIAKTLKTKNLTAEQQNAGWAGLVDAWSQEARVDKITLTSANSLFTQNGLPMKPEFMAALARYYRSGVWQVDFENNTDAAIRVINNWASQQTHGKITELFEPGELDQDTVAVLANAVYFNALWKQPFGGFSDQGVFFGVKPSTATFMVNSLATLRSADTSSYQAVELPYTGGRFSALAVMPTKGSLSDFIGSLTVDSLIGVVTSLQVGDGREVRLPRLDISSNLDLKQVLTQMGMPTAFQGSADFTATTSTNPSVGAIRQRVYLGVNEKGTEAAAVTGESFEAVSRHLSLDFDHPFLFLIRDTVTGAILFASQIENPSGK